MKQINSQVVRASQAIIDTHVKCWYDPGSFSLHEERMRFLRVVLSHKEIAGWQTLYQEVYLPLEDSLRSGNSALGGLGCTLLDQWARTLRLPGVIDLPTGSWCKSWVMVAADSVLWSWSTTDEVELKGCAHKRRMPIFVYLIPWKFDWPHWVDSNPPVTEQEYRNHANTAWSTSLEKYIANHKQKHERAAKKRVRKGTTIDRRYEWAALHTCKSWSFRKIAEQYGVDRRAVRVKVREILLRLGL